MNIKRVKSVSFRLAMFAAFAVNTIVWAADVTLSFGAGGGSKSTSQFSLGSQALTFDKTTIPSWITSMTIHQSIGGMINNSINLTPASGTWNTSGSPSTCTLDVTVAENTGAERSWTMNILNQSNGSVAWSMFVQQSAGSGGGTPTTYYTVTFNPNAGSVGESTRSVASGSSIGTLPTPSRTGYSFNGWFTEASDGSQISSSTAVYADVTYYAQWTEVVRPVSGAILYVDAENGLDTNAGTSSTDAKATIQAAIDAAPEGATIYVAPGTYAPVFSENRLLTIKSTHGAAMTIIDGGNRQRCVQASAYDIYSKDSSPTVYTNTVVDGFSLINGNVTAGDYYPTYGGLGGGMYAGIARNCIFRNNTARGGGGADSCFLYNCLFTGNTAQYNGGGAENSIVYNCTFTGNDARDGGGRCLQLRIVQLHSLWKHGKKWQRV